MSTSLSFSWNTTVSELINRSLRIVGALPVGNQPSADEYTNAKYALNALIKRISVDGVKLWTLEEVVYSIPTPSTTLGTNGASYYCIKNHTLSASTTPISGTTSTDYWAIGADTTSTVLPIGTSCVSSNQLSLSGSYQGIDSAFYRENNVDYPMTILSYQDYFKIQDKFIRTTIPTHLGIMSPLNSDNSISIYPYPYTCTGRIHILAVKLIEDVVNSTENPGLAPEWMEFLAYGLAAMLADEYSRPLDERGFLQNKALTLYREATNNDRTINDTITVVGGYSTR